MSDPSPDSGSSAESSILSREFFQRDPESCARELIGCHLVWNGCRGRIVETEAYAEFGDEACHTFFRPSAREFITKNQAGAAYVYLNYGMYWLTNVLVKGGDSNGFVLIRALEPIEPIKAMKDRRDKEKLKDLCSGPGKLSMAFGITGDDHGKSFVRSTKRCFERSPDDEPVDVVADGRIGISRAQELNWRFLEADSDFVSVRFRRS